MTINNIAEKLVNTDSALIFCHVRPDGDTLSCAFALKKAMQKLGKRANVVCGDTIPNKYIDFFTEPILTKAEGGYSTYIAVDCASIDMLGVNKDFFNRQNNTIVIDHHESNSKFAKINYVDKQPAASIIIFELIEVLNVTIDRDLAETLLVGILTDTGCFAHSDVDSKTLLVGSKLLSYGADIGELYNKLFRSQEKARAELYIKVMSEMKFYHNDKLAIITIRDADMKKYGLDRGATEGFIDFPMTIKGVEVAISVFEQGEKQFKLSFRSKNVDVNRIASTFGGGGHKLASGGMLCGYYEDVIDKLVFTVGNYL